MPPPENKNNREWRDTKNTRITSIVWIEVKEIMLNFASEMIAAAKDVNCIVMGSES